MKQPKKLDINTLTFDTDIEHLISKCGMTYMEAVIHWSEEKKIEIEFVASLIKKDANIKAKLKEEAEDLNFIKKEAQLPF